MSTKGNITLCLTSMAVGAVVGLLLAPSSGRETRQTLLRRGEEMKGKLSDLYDEGSQYINRGKQQLSEVADRARNRAEDTAEDAKNAANRVAGSTAGGRTTASSTNGGASRS